MKNIAKKKIKFILTLLIIFGILTSLFCKITEAGPSSSISKENCNHKNATYSYEEWLPCNSIDGKFEDTIYKVCEDCGLKEKVGTGIREDIHEKEIVEYNGKKYCLACGKEIGNDNEESLYKKDTKNAILLNRKYILDNNFKVFKNNVPVKCSMEDKTAEDKKCDHRIAKYYFVNGNKIIEKVSCFDCFYEQYNILDESAYDTLEEREELLVFGEDIKKFFDDLGLNTSNEKEASIDEEGKIKYVPKDIIKKEGKIVYETSMLYNETNYKISYFENDVLELIAEKFDKYYVARLNIKTGDIQIEELGENGILYDIEFSDKDAIYAIENVTGKTNVIDLKKETYIIEPTITEDVLKPFIGVILNFAKQTDLKIFDNVENKIKSGITFSDYITKEIRDKAVFTKSN